MRIASLSPEVTELLLHWGLGDSLVGVSAGCELPSSAHALPRLARKQGGEIQVHRELLAAAAPDLVIALCAEAQHASLRSKVQRYAGEAAAVATFDPRTIEQVREYFVALARRCGVPAKGVSLSQRLKAQLMDWGDNFYERSKSKRVTFLSSVAPLELAGCWIPDLISLASCVNQSRDTEDARAVTWEEILQFRPDVIVIAPKGADLLSAVRLLPELHQTPIWEELPAVKRGDVIFAPGDGLFYRPTQRLIESAAILFSAVAGFESGYITPRDSFYRLRWIELHRHRFFP